MNKYKLEGKKKKPGGGGRFAELLGPWLASMSLRAEG